MAVILTGYDEDGMPVYADYDTDYDPDVPPIDGGDTGGGDTGVPTDSIYGDPGPGGVRNADGTITYTYDDGSTSTVNADGSPVGSTAGDASTGWMPKGALTGWERILQKATTNGKVDWTKLAHLGASGLATAWAVNKALNPTKVGYQGGIPSLTATRQALTQQPGVRPGAGGQRYLTDTKFSTEAGLPAAQAAVQTQADLRNAQNVARVPAPVAPQAPKDYSAFFGRAPQPQMQPQMQPEPEPQQLAKGGITGTYLRGGTDGMADRLPANIDGKQPAKLSHGEFIIPADVVAHLGNGNSDAGAEHLYEMMRRIRKDRTGNPEQGKQIDPKKYTGGGIAAAYATGGDVVAPAGTVGTEQGISGYAGPYVTNMLAQGQALANQPYEAYGGPLTAGASPLQADAFGAAGALQTPGIIGESATAAGAAGTQMGGLAYTPTGQTWDAGMATQYMNPYLQASLNPQLEEARRQSQITQLGNAAKMTGAGAFGGSRQAIMDAETQRNLGTNLANITGTGYKTAYDTALQQFNTAQGRDVQEAQFGAKFGLDALTGQVNAAQTAGQLGATQNAAGLANLDALIKAGGIQRDIEQQGITADQAAFTAERDYPARMLQFQQSLLQGLPITSQQYVKDVNPFTPVVNAGTAVMAPAPV